MALKNWSRVSTPLQELNDGSSDFWTTSSGGGTNEYYYNQTGININPVAVTVSGVDLSEGVVGSLGIGEYGWGDNDSIGNDVLYVRTEGEGDPDDKQTGSVMCSKEYQIMQGTVGTEVVLLSFIISNYTFDSSVAIFVYHKNSAETIYFLWRLDVPSVSSPFVLDSRICLNDNDIISVQCSKEETCILISGDETYNT